MRDRLTVFQLTNGIYPFQQAGTEIYSAEIADALAGRGLIVHVAFPRRARQHEIELEKNKARFKIHQIDLAPTRWYGNKLRLITLRRRLWQAELQTLIKKTKPDIIHIHHASGFGFSAIELLAGFGVPLVITLPDYWLLCPSALWRCQGDLSKCAELCCSELRVKRLGKLATMAFLSHRKRRIMRLVERHRPTLAAISESTRYIFEKAGFPADLLLTHTWGIDIDDIRSQSHSVSRLPGSTIRIGYLGTLRPHKGCHVLLEAFRRLNKKATLHFYGHGDGAYIRQLEARATGFQVYFHGAFDHSQTGSILAGLDLVVIPSLWDESYCLVYQEAMAAKKPVIASRVGGLADRIKDGVNGFFSPPGDSVALADLINRLLTDLDTVEQSLDFELCSRSISDDAADWDSLYERLLRERRSAAARATVVPASGTCA